MKIKILRFLNTEYRVSSMFIQVYTNRFTIIPNSKYEVWFISSGLRVLWFHSSSDYLAHNNFVTLWGCLEIEHFYATRENSSQDEDCRGVILSSGRS